jgi:parallel beta-helix repeat protein
MKTMTRLLFCLCLVGAAAHAQTQVLYVDDDGVDCPEASYSSIQAAVNAASAGALILVCPGTYQEGVQIVGASKNGISLMANGDRDAVVIKGNHVSWRAGVLLQDVSGVRVSGFTLRDHGIPRVPTQPGVGEGILLNRVQFSVIDHNYSTNNNMMGITVANSSNNLIEHNHTIDNDPMMLGCGIHLGPGGGNNVVRFNRVSGNALAGIMLRQTGAGNVVENNNVSSNGRSGFFIDRVPDAFLRNNHASNMMGPPMEPSDVPPNISHTALGEGIYVIGSTNVKVSGNHAIHNANLDARWDGAGQVSWDDNQCQTSSSQGLCK